MKSGLWREEGEGLEMERERASSQEENERGAGVDSRSEGLGCFRRYSRRTSVLDCQTL